MSENIDEVPYMKIAKDVELFRSGFKLNVKAYISTTIGTSKGKTS